MARIASSDWLTTRGASWLCSNTSPATTTNSAPASAASAPARHDVAAGGRIARLRLAVEEVTGHAELPVGGVHESHLDPPSLPLSLPGVASVGPAADKSRDVRRHALR